MKSEHEGRAPAGERRPFVVFTLAGGSYAVPSDVVLHLAMPGETTLVPNAPAYVAGVTSIRGRITPVVDLRGLLGFDTAPDDARTRLIVVSVRGRELALRVDGAREFAMLPAEAVQPLLGAAQDIGGEFVKGMAQMDERLIMLLDVESVLAERTVRPKLSAGVSAGGSDDGTVA